MFRDLKEYQDIVKIYTEKVSKSENLKEQIVGSMPAKTAGSGNVRGSGIQKKLNTGKVTPQSQIRKIDPKQFDNRSAAVTTNTPTGGSLKAGSFGISQAGKQQAAANRAEFKAKADAVKASSTPTTSSVSTETKPQSKMIRDPKTRTMKRRGSPTAQRAENKERAKLKAQALAKARNAAKKDGTYQKPKTAQELAKERIAAKKAGTYQKPKTAQELAKERIAAKNKTVEKKVEKSTTTPTTTPIGKPMPSNVPGGVSGKGKETDDFSKDPKYQSTAGKSTDIKQSSGSNKRAEAAKRRREMQNNQKNIKKKEAFENNPRVKNFRKKVEDLKTTAKYGSTATIQTQDGKEFKPGDPGYEAELKKARNVVRKSMQKNSYEPDAYDMVLEYLLSTEQATTIEEANYVMMQLDEENIQEIVGAIAKTVMKTPLVKLVPAAIGTGIATKMIASKLGQKSVKPVKPPVVKTPTKDIQVGDGIEQRKKDESLMDYYKRRKNSLETQDKKLGAGEY